jgi:hypothetical protein
MLDVKAVSALQIFRHVMIRIGFLQFCTVFIHPTEDVIQAGICT